MSDYTERLWEDLHDLLLGLDSKFSGPEEAAVGCYGGRLVRAIYQTELLHGNEGLSVYWELLWAGFESLVSDYRISDNELMGMRFAYSQLRRDASASNDPRTSRGGKSDSLH